MNNRKTTNTASMHEAQPNISRLEYVKTDHEGESSNCGKAPSLSLPAAKGPQTTKSSPTQPRENPNRPLLEAVSQDDGLGSDAAVNTVGQLCETAERRGYNAGMTTAQESYKDEGIRNASLLEKAIHELKAFQDEQRVKNQVDIVAISLKIAEKILCRQVEVDGLFLAASVRHAIDHLETSTKLVLKVSANDHLDWLSLLGNVHETKAVSIVSDPVLESGICRIESGGAVVDLSAWMQLDEISKRFDRMLGEGLPTAHRKAKQ